MFRRTFEWLAALLLATNTLAASPPAASDTGRRVFDYYCYQCHGYNGDARTVAAQFLRVKPRDFTRTRPADLTRDAMLKTVRDGKDGSPMRGFSRVLKPAEIVAVVDYVRTKFMGAPRTDHRYHTVANGWPDHRRHAAAFPYAEGRLPIDRPWESLTETQRAGRKVFLAACVSCHEPVRTSAAPVWESDAVTYPKNTETCDGCHDSSRHLHENASLPRATGQRTAFTVHADAPVRPLSSAGAAGRALFLKNCSFCHAADGTGRNWIGAFLDPPPRNLVAPGFLDGLDDAQLAERIRKGLPGTSMPAWGGILSKTEIDAVVRYLREIVAQHPRQDNVVKTAVRAAEPASGAPGWTRAPR